jgi:hypothetical protein
MKVLPGGCPIKPGFGLLGWNPVKRGLCNVRKIGSGAAFVNTQWDAKGEWRLSASGQQEDVSKRQGHSVQLSNCPTQAKKHRA